MVGTLLNGKGMLEGLQQCSSKVVQCDKIDFLPKQEVPQKVEAEIVRKIAKSKAKYQADRDGNGISEKNCRKNKKRGY